MIEDRVRANLRAEAAALPAASPATEPLVRRRRIRPLLVVATAAAVVLVAVGGAALLLRDGGGTPNLLADAPPAGAIEWTAVDAGLAGFNPAGVVHGPAGFVIAADSTDFESAGAAAISQDGEAWEVTTVDAFGGYQLMDLAAGDAGYVAVGLRSPVASPTQSPDLAVFRSADGRSWTAARLEVPPLPAGAARGEAFPNGLVATGDLALARAVYLTGPEGGELAAQDLLWLSQDGGVTWSPVDAGVFGPDASVLGVAAAPAGLLAIVEEAGGATAWTSADGEAWEEAATPGPRVRAVVGGAPGYLAVTLAGSGSQVWWSGDGAAWEPVLVVEDGFVSDFSASAAGFTVALADAPGAGEPVDPWQAVATLHFSPDGTAWRPVAGPEDFPAGFLRQPGVAAASGRLVAVMLPGPDALVTPGTEPGPVAIVGAAAE